MESCNIPIRILAIKHGQRPNFILLHIEELQPQTCQIHHKDQQGEEGSSDALRKATRIIKKDTKRKKEILQLHQYCTCELIEELI
jgi:hypothetical protein